MSRNKPFVAQLVIVGGFLVFIYIFFSLATSIYKDYKLDTNIGKFEDEINKLADLAYQKPKDVAFLESPEYKDRYAKENLNLLNPGERLIIIPTEDQVVRTEAIDLKSNDFSDVLKLPYRNQWWEYFFGRTLSVSAEKSEPSALPSDGAEPATTGEG